ncbi:MAG: hypothetical protein AB9903_21795 [Vulcanimicrobiota bacterium]
MKRQYRTTISLTLLLVIFASTVLFAANPEFIVSIRDSEFFNSLHCQFLRHYQGDGMQIYSVDTKKYAFNVDAGVMMKFVLSRDTNVMDNEMLKHSPAVKTSETTRRIGNKCRQWFRSDGGTILFYRDNVLVKFAYKGAQQSAENFAHAIDNQLIKGKYCNLGSVK